MSLVSFTTVLEQARRHKKKSRVVVAGSETEHALEGVFDAQREGVVYPVLVGNRLKTIELIKRLGYENDPYTMVDNPDGTNPAQIAVELINKEEGDFLMKGLIETADFLRPIVDRKNNLNTGRTMSHFTLADIPSYPKLLTMSDAAMIVQPDLATKKSIIINVVETLHKLCCENPKVALICAVETVNPKQPETVDAQYLVEMWKNGEFPQCEIVGPISYDLALSKEAARIKGYDCKWSGEFDALIVPNLVTGNVLGKCWILNCGSVLCGMVVGAKVPVALSTRSASREDKFRSLALCAAVCQNC